MRKAASPEERKKRIRASMLRRRARLKADGLCQQCGNNPPFPKRTLCIACLNDRASREKDRQALIKSRAAPAHAEAVLASSQTPLVTQCQAPLQRLRLDPEMYWPNFCIWKYKSTQCGYTGALATCTRTLDGTNGCEAHNNQVRFGGFPGIDSNGAQAAGVSLPDVPPVFQTPPLSLGSKIARIFAKIRATLR